MSCSFQSEGDRNTTRRPRFNNINDFLGRGHDDRGKFKKKIIKRSTHIQYIRVYAIRVVPILIVVVVVVVVIMRTMCVCYVLL